MGWLPEVNWNNAGQILAALSPAAAIVETIRTGTIPQAAAVFSPAVAIAQHPAEAAALVSALSPAAAIEETIRTGTIPEAAALFSPGVFFAYHPELASPALWAIENPDLVPVPLPPLPIVEEVKTWLYVLAAIIILVILALLWYLFKDSGANIKAIAPLAIKGAKLSAGIPF